MFCDDTAAGHQKISGKISGIKRAFQDFERCTGLKLNTKKTVLLTTLTKSARGEIERSLIENNWGEVNIREMGVYLGIPIGRPPDTEISHAYREKVEEFRRRLKRYMAHKKSLSIAKRIALVNVFLRPLFDYPNRFFIMPTKGILDKVNSDIATFLCKGCSFEGRQYCREKTNMGLRGGSVLIDFQTMNLAILASKAVLHDPEPKTTKVASYKKRRISGEYTRTVSKRKLNYTWAMRIKTQRKIAVEYISSQYGLEEGEFVGKPQGFIYKLILRSHSWQSAFRNYTAKKLAKWGTPEVAQQVVIDNHSRIPSWVPDYVIFHQIYLTHGALLDSERLSKIADEENARGGSKAPHIKRIQNCYLCQEDRASDSARHVYQHCATTKWAMGLMLHMLGMEPYGSLRQATSCERELHPAHTGVIYVFNQTVWQLREELKNTQLHSERKKYAKEIWLRTFAKVARLTPVSITDAVFPGNKISENQKKLHKAKIKTYGAAGKRSEDQRSAAVKKTMDTIAGLPEGSTIAFTDGSSIGNPGPAGAGAVIWEKDGEDMANLSFYLGENTNQGAEIWAIGGVIEFLMDKRIPKKLHIFSDSEFAINCVQRKWYTNKHFVMVEAVRERMKQINATIIFHHVAGHAGIEANEKADKLAKQGADYSEKTHSRIDTDNILHNHNFMYLIVPDSDNDWSAM